MTNLFDLKGTVVINPDILGVPGFREIWDRDKDKKKAKAYRELSYIYYTSDYKSPYAVYPNDKREEIVQNDFMGSRWSPDEVVKEAQQRYKEFQQTPSLRLFQAAMQATNKLTEYFNDVDFTKTDEEGSPIYTAKDVAVNLEKVGKIVESLSKLEDKVKKEITQESRIRGGGEAGEYER